MILAIDASNIKAGGGFTHLYELLDHADPQQFGIKQVIVWGGDQLDKLPEKKWLVKRKHPHLLAKSLLKEQFFRAFVLPELAKSCDLLFSPGGTYSNSKVPYVSMSQNMLIWEDKERDRFELKDRLKLRFIQWVQKRSFRNSKGIIFISNYAKQYITNKLPSISSKSNVVIYHGTNERFIQQPSVNDLDLSKRINLLYVSMINHYKFQWNVIEAVTQIRDEEGLDVHLDMVGGKKLSVFKMMSAQLERTKDYIHYHGPVEYGLIESFYKNADAFVFASTCENMPNILIEAMSAGCPIASSNYGPMPEILEDAGVYFDPVSVSEIKYSILQLLKNDKERQTLAERAYESAKKFKWNKTSNQTFKFFAECLT